MWFLVTRVIFFSATLMCIMGEGVTVKVPGTSRDSLDQCRLPLALILGVRRPWYQTNFTLDLTRHDIVSPVRKVYIMKADSNGTASIVEKILPNDEVEAMQAYHNEHTGAAFIVQCVRVKTGGLLYLPEGTIFLGEEKFRLFPVSDWPARFFVLPSGVVIPYLMEKSPEINAGECRAIKGPSLPPPESVTSDESPASHHRGKRQAVVYNIDILPIVDSFIWERFRNKTNKTDEAEKNLRNYLLNIFSGANMRMKTLNLDQRSLTIRMIPPVFLQNETVAPYYTGAPNLKITENEVTKLNATVLLELFKVWLVNHSNLPQYDHAILFTGFPLTGGGDSGIKFNLTKGLAYVRELCHGNGLSSSVVEDNGGYQSEGVVAHELGHNFGSDHDGDNNTCKSEDRYLMSDGVYTATNSSRFNPWKFSNCSSSRIKDFINVLETNNTYKTQCLEKSLGDAAINISEKNATDHCTEFFGEDSFVCRGKNIISFDLMCEELYCRVPRNNTCELITAAEGTCCGNEKNCIDGRCVSSDAGKCKMDAECPLGDQPGYVLDNIMCKDILSTHCYEDEIRIRCCDTCRRLKTNITDCEYGDKRFNCPSNKCGLNFTNGSDMGQSVKSLCCKTCYGYVEPLCSDEPTFEIGNVTYTCEQAILGNHTSLCYMDDGHQVCCSYCEKVKNQLPPSPGCFWGDKAPNCNILLNKMLYSCNENQTASCCDTCSGVNNLTTAPTPTTTMTSTNTRPATTPTPATTMTSTNTRPATTPTPATTMTSTNTRPATTPTPTTTMTSTNTRPATTPTPATMTSTSARPPTTTAMTVAPKRCSDIFCELGSGKIFDLNLWCLLILTCYFLRALLGC